MIHLSGNLDVGRYGRGREGMLNRFFESNATLVCISGSNFSALPPQSLHWAFFPSRAPVSTGTSHSHVQVHYKKAWSLCKLAWNLLSTKKFHPGITFCYCCCPNTTQWRRIGTYDEGYYPIVHVCIGNWFCRDVSQVSTWARFGPMVLGSPGRKLSLVDPAWQRDTSETHEINQNVSEIVSVSY